MEVSAEELNYLVDLKVKKALQSDDSKKQPTPWSYLSNEIDLGLASWDPHEAYALKSAFCTIIRNSIGTDKSVRQLDELEVERARNVVTELLKMLDGDEKNF
ncbi:hypothetical protein [Lactobacillus acetotolerans]|uniref:hypothetical protein n=1 Tax=Lactobacillus acetotolerans TaxID=1600 RepID=UPI002FDA18B4